MCNHVQLHDAANVVAQVRVHVRRAADLALLLAIPSDELHGVGGLEPGKIAAISIADATPEPSSSAPGLFTESKCPLTMKWTIGKLRAGLGGNDVVVCRSLIGESVHVDRQAEALKRGGDVVAAWIVLHAVDATVHAVVREQQVIQIVPKVVHIDAPGDGLPDTLTCLQRPSHASQQASQHTGRKARFLPARQMFQHASSVASQGLRPPGSCTGPTSSGIGQRRGRLAREWLLPTQSPQDVRQKMRSS